MNIKLNYVVCNMGMDVESSPILRPIVNTYTVVCNIIKNFTCIMQFVIF